MNEKITAKTIRRDARFFRTDIDMAITLAPAFLKDIAEAQNRLLYKIAERMEELEVKTEPARHGHWIEKEVFIPWCDDDVDIIYECSSCEAESGGISPYCPNCGARNFVNR